MAKKSATNEKEIPVSNPVIPVTVHVLTRKQWSENPTLQRQLQEILDTPILKMAFATLLHAAMPSAPPVTNLIPGVSAEAMALADSNRYHHRSGMTHFYRALHGLARPVNSVKYQSEWGELLDDSE